MKKIAYYLIQFTWGLLENIIGFFDGVLLVKNVDYTFVDNSLKATNTGLNKITNSNASILKVEIAGD